MDTSTTGTGATEPSPVASPPAPPPASLSAPPRKSRAWIGWLIACAVALSLLIGSCAWLFWTVGEAFGPSNGFGAATSGDSVAIIRLEQAIAGTGGLDYVTPETFSAALKQAEDDDNVKAVVLRVDSPGGTVAASEEIAAAVKACRKPVVVSVGDICASGAYMVSSQADKIIAMPGSTVGSIGVITEIPNVEGLLDKLGVKFTVITAGKYKDAGSPYRELSAEEVKMLNQEIDVVYGQFIDIVAQGRGMKREQVEKLANGWAWPGTTAKGLGLIDQIGGFDDAVKVAGRLGGISGRPNTVEIPLYEPGRIIDELLGLQVRTGLRIPGLDSESAIREALPK
jgi:protease-4